MLDTLNVQKLCQEIKIDIKDTVTVHRIIKRIPQHE